MDKYNGYMMIGSLDGILVSNRGLIYKTIDELYNALVFLCDKLEPYKQIYKSSKELSDALKTKSMIHYKIGSEMVTIIGIQATTKSYKPDMLTKDIELRDCSRY